jgi:hypothetical protein
MFTFGGDGRRHEPREIPIPAASTLPSADVSFVALERQRRTNAANDFHRKDALNKE